MVPVWVAVISGVGGLVIGAVLGVVVISLCVMAGDSGRQ